MARRVKLPKRIAGVKIPKAIRKGPVMDFLNTPAGQVVLAQAVLLMGGAFAVDKARDSGAMKNPLQALTGAGHDLQDRASHTAAKLTQAFAAAAHAFRDVMESDDDLPHAKASGSMAEAAQSSADVTDDQAEGSRKKSRSRAEAPSTPH